MSYDIFFYLNTVEHSFLRFYTIWDDDYGDGLPQPNIFVASPKGYGIMSIYSEFFKQCVDDCSELGGNWENPDNLFDTDNTCECIPGFFKLSDGSCYDCSLIDPDCFACSGLSTCTECNYGLYLD